MLTTSVILLLSFISIIAPTQLFGFKLKQANIYSEIASDSSVREFVGLPTEFIPLEQHSAEFMYALEDMKDRIVDSIEIIHDSEIDSTPIVVRPPVVVPAGVIAIEDFSDNGYLLKPFYDALTKSNSRRLRVAVLGDSFIEGDIMTADLREMFQNQYAGAGVGFVPITSQVAKYRGSLVHTFDKEGWSQYSLIKEASRRDYTLSGYTFVPRKEGAWVEYAGSKFRKHLNAFGQATLMFINRGSSKILVTINNNKQQEFSPKSSEELQSIVLKDSIYKIRFEIQNIDGFTAYGALLDNQTGVCVDNYSIRGHSGLGLSSISQSLSGQMSRISPCDLILLEYGLNVVEQENTNYTYYRTQMIKVVEHIKLCYPSVPIVLLGVSDRSTMKNGSFVTMPGVVAMDKTQREIAKRCGITYWSTLQAMRQLGGMEKFVENGWAAKDYTHIGPKGGQKMAQKLYEGIKIGK